jgi:membrane protease YdiL (CAAX protease family)
MALKRSSGLCAPTEQSGLARCVSQFASSVLPWDRWQLTLIAAAICFLIGPHLGWHLQFRVPAESLKAVRFLVGSALTAVFVSGVGTCFIFLRPSNRSSFLSLLGACLPAFLGIIVFAGLEYGGTSRIALVPLGPGFHSALAGFLLGMIFIFRVALGQSSLSFVLPKSSAVGSIDTDLWSRVQYFIWVLIALLPFLTWTLPFQRVGEPFFSSRFVLSSIRVSILDIAIILIGVWVIGKESVSQIRKLSCWPRLQYLCFATAIPVGVALLIYTVQFLFALPKLYLSGGNFRLVYFHSYLSYWPLLLIALCEEILFRGLLQPFFIRRYGLLRGLFLIGLVFAASHLSTDFSVGFTDVLVVTKVALRLVESLGLSFVLGWLVVRAKSIVPAAIAHGLFNVLGFAPLGPAFPGIGPVIDILWVLTACVLFYWFSPNDAWRVRRAPDPSDEDL